MRSCKDIMVGQFMVTVSDIKLHVGAGRPWADVQLALRGDYKTLHGMATSINQNPNRKE